MKHNTAPATHNRSRIPERISVAILVGTLALTACSSRSQRPQPTPSPKPVIGCEITNPAIGPRNQRELLITLGGHAAPKNVVLHRVDVDWGDGTSSYRNVFTELAHPYTHVGDYGVAAKATFEQFGQDLPPVPCSGKLRATVTTDNLTIGH